jgi:hypothetical protein
MNNSIYKFGTLAMGTKMVPAYYANLFMGKLEEHLIPHPYMILNKERGRVSYSV